MKQPEITKGWVQAGIALSKEPSAAVICPVCKQANLVVQDVPMEGVQVERAAQKFERIMTCPNCNSRNILLLNTKH